VVEEAFGKIQFGGAGVLVDVRIKLSGAIKRAMLVSPGERFELDPPRNTKEGRRELARRARRESWRRSRLYTSGRAALERLRGSRDSPWRHATRGVARVVIPLIVVTGLFSFFPHIDIPFPSINLDLPTIPSPELPTINLPGWLQWILERSHYIVPILIGLGLSLLEIRRRRAAHADPRTPASKVERLARRYFGPGRD
jgi:hypothetical protein